jgi:hypothetical protein
VIDSRSNPAVTVFDHPDNVVLPGLPRSDGQFQLGEGIPVAGKAFEFFEPRSLTNVDAPP